MKNRTIEELHDSHIGHRKFASICDLLINKGYQISNIKEYNEQFKFYINNEMFVFRKEWKSSAKSFVEYVEKLIDMRQKLEALK